ncbi:tetratricopeptide repeat protein [Luteolibacter sp. Populi]|uniref:tetratricopeptide repeat protein n=1 Tax=Luteolibacter sp. Populi TaxID=3230487 RepID=UPI0034651FFC
MIYQGFVTKKERIEAIRQAHEKGQIGYTRELCERYLRKNPDSGFVWLILANNLIALSLYTEASAALDRAEALVPDQPKKLANVIAHRGHLAEAAGRFEEAGEYFLRAHELDLDDATWLIFAGDAAGRNGEIEKSLELVTRATLCPEGCIDEAHFNRGGKLLVLKRYAEAAEAYRSALAIDPTYESALRRLEDLEMIQKAKWRTRKPG